MSALTMPIRALVRRVQSLTWRADAVIARANRRLARHRLLGPITDEEVQP